MPAAMAARIATAVAQCANQRTLFEAAFRASLRRYPTWLQGQQVAELFTSPVLHLITRIPWTIIRRREAAELQPKAQLFAMAYRALREAEVAGIDFLGRIPENDRGRPLLDAAIMNSQAEGRTSQALLNQWHRSQFDSVSLSQVPAWVDYITPASELGVAQRTAEVAAPAVRRWAEGPYYAPEPPPRQDDRGGTPDVLGYVALAGFAWAGWKYLNQKRT